ncbi:MAG: hypothetical protein ACK5H2_08545 [Beutenbergiaceae bacterium]
MTSLHPSSSILGLDLSGTGAPRGFGNDSGSDAEAFIMGRLAGLATLADKGGVDLLTLDSTFRVGGRRRDEWLDGALAAARLGRHTSRLTVAAAVPLGSSDAAGVATAIGSVHKATDGRAAWQVDGGTAARGVSAVTSRLTKSNAKVPAAQVVVAVTGPLDLELAAARADIARIRPASLSEAVELRSAIRQAAQDWGRAADDVRVIVDLKAVIGADEEGAVARADLLAGFDPDAAQVLEFVGTATGLADLWQEWVDAGAADGFTIVPTSVPTDVLAVVTELAPELQRRGLHGPVPATSAASDSAGRQSARGTRRVPARSGRKVPVAA